MQNCQWYLAKIDVQYMMDALSDTHYTQESGNISMGDK